MHHPMHHPSETRAALIFATLEACAKLRRIRIVPTDAHCHTGRIVIHADIPGGIEIFADGIEITPTGASA